MRSTRFHADAAVLADAIIADVGRDIVLGLPLGLGKANHVANALLPAPAPSAGLASTPPRPPQADIERAFAAMAGMGRAVAHDQLAPSFANLELPAIIGVIGA